jgi:hypothetical protein
MYISLSLSLSILFEILCINHIFFSICSIIFPFENQYCIFALGAITRVRDVLQMPCFC